MLYVMPYVCWRCVVGYGGSGAVSFHPTDRVLTSGRLDTLLLMLNLLDAAVGAAVLQSSSLLSQCPSLLPSAPPSCKATTTSTSKALCVSVCLCFAPQDAPVSNAGCGSNLTLSGGVECDASIMSGAGPHGAVGAVPGNSQGGEGGRGRGLYRDGCRGAL